MDILNRIGNGEKPASVSKETGIPLTTLTGWVKNKVKLEASAQQGLKLSKFRDQKSHEPMVEECTVAWLRDLQSQKESVPISHLLLCQNSGLRMER